MWRFYAKRVDGLFINGSYGAGVMMTEEERRKVAEQTMDAAQGKVPVIVHVGTADSRSAARLTKHAVEIGASAVAAVGPFYFKHNAESVCQFFGEIVKSTDGKIPVYVYNNPNFQGYKMEMPLVRRLKEEVGVQGVKDATFDIMTMGNYMRTLKDETFDVALGTEAMWLSACALGCKAFIPGLGNAFPEICRRMFQQGIEGDYEACRETQFVVNEMRDIMYLTFSTQMAIYAMLEIRGIVRAYPRAPFIPATEEQKQAIRKRLSELKIL